MGILDQLTQDMNAYWQQPDSSQAWGGGTLKKTGNTAMFDPGGGGQVQYFNQNQTPQQIAAASPLVANQWQSQYGPGIMDALSPPAPTANNVQSDINSYWQGPDSIQQWGGGTLAKTGNTAKYTPTGGGASQYFNSDQNIEELLKNPLVTNEWQGQYGTDIVDKLNPKTGLVDTIESDMESFWNSPDGSQKWGGGTLLKSGGTAVYTPPGGGAPQYFNKNQSIGELSQNPVVLNEWQKQYGGKTDTTDPLDPDPVKTPWDITQGGGDLNATQDGNEFIIPEDKFPTSSSVSTNQSGIDWNSPLLKALLPQLIASGQGVQDKADNLSKTLSEQYGNLIDRSQSAENFQGTLNELAGRNVLNSSVTGEALGRASALNAKSVADKAYDANVAGAQSQFAVPGIIASLANLGQTSSGASASTSKQPNVPFEIMQRFLLS
jgi:hypothetical protein